MKRWDRTKILLAVGFVLVTTVLILILIDATGMFGVWIDVLRRNPQAIAAGATTVSVVVASVALVGTWIANWRGWKRRKRQSTLDAYSEWSDSVVDARNRITNLVGPHRLDFDQATNLIRAASDRTIKFVGPMGKLESTQIKELVNAIADVLNGMERLAIGIKWRIYDIDTLASLGATTIIRQHNRLEEYIHVRRTAASSEKRQARAYVELDILVRRLQRKKYDPERLSNLQ